MGTAIAIAACAVYLYIAIGAVLDERLPRYYPDTPAPKSVLGGIVMSLTVLIEMLAWPIRLRIHLKTRQKS